MADTGIKSFCEYTLSQWLLGGWGRRDELAKETDWPPDFVGSGKPPKCPPSTPLSGATVLQSEELRAVIDSAKARGTGSLERWILKRLPDASEQEIEEAVEVAVEIIESVPIFLARASQEAEQRGLTEVVEPLLDHARRYFLMPIDLIPEMTYGLAGLLDDAYLVLRLLQNLDRGPEPFLDWDLEYPVLFLRGLVGEKISRQLDVLSLGAMQELDGQLGQIWGDIPEA